MHESHIQKCDTLNVTNVRWEIRITRVVLLSTTVKEFRKLVNVCQSYA